MSLEDDVMARRCDVAARVVLLGGCIVGWVFSEDLLLELWAHWPEPSGIYEGPRGWYLVSLYASVAALVGTVAALPVVALACTWSLAPLFAPVRTVSIPIFLSLSYLAIAGGLLLGAVWLLPQLVESERAIGRLGMLWPWVYIEYELEWVFYLTLAGQLSAFALLAPIRSRARSTSRPA